MLKFQRAIYPIIQRHQLIIINKFDEYLTLCPVDLDGPRVVLREIQDITKPFMYPVRGNSWAGNIKTAHQCILPFNVIHDGHVFLVHVSTDAERTAPLNTTQNNRKLSPAPATTCSADCKKQNAFDSRTVQPLVSRYND
jgi:hypothetical protein